jgi:hypothetical protein
MKGSSEWETRNAHRIVCGTSWKILGRLRQRSDNDIELDPMEVSCDDGDRIELYQNFV